MADIRDDDLFIISRDGKDHKAQVNQFAKDIVINVPCCDVEWDQIQNKPPGLGVPPGDGTLRLKDSDGKTVGTFTANQAGDTNVTLPKGFTGSWDDLNDKPTTFPPSDHSHSYNDLSDKPEINNGKLTFKDSKGDIVGEFTANQKGNTTIELTGGGFDEAPSDGEWYVRRNGAWERGLPYDFTKLQRL